MLEAYLILSFLISSTYVESVSSLIDPLDHIVVFREEYSE